MTARAPLTDLTVLEWHTAKANKKLCVIAYHIPTGAGVQIVAETPKDMRHHSLGRGKTVGELRTGEATDAVQ